MIYLQSINISLHSLSPLSHLSHSLPSPPLHKHTFDQTRRVGGEAEDCDGCNGFGSLPPPFPVPSPLSPLPSLLLSSPLPSPPLPLSPLLSSLPLPLFTTILSIKQGESEGKRKTAIAATGLPFGVKYENSYAFQISSPMNGRAACEKVKK